MIRGSSFFDFSRLCRVTYHHGLILMTTLFAEHLAAVHSPSTHASTFATILRRLFATDLLAFIFKSIHMNTNIYNRVLRGGSWYNVLAYMRAANRDYGTPSYRRRSAVGFNL